MSRKDFFTDEMLKLNIFREIDPIKLKKQELCHNLSIILDIPVDAVLSKCFKFDIDKIVEIKKLCHLGYRLMDAIELYASNQRRIEKIFGLSGKIVE